MKYYIESSMRYYESIYPTAISVLQHMFCTLGNGVDLDNKGWLRGNYKHKEAFEFPPPTPLVCIYPWTETEQYQPFRKLAGCRDIGFKEAVRYFMDCLKMTDNSVEGVKDWKDNIHIMEDVLLNTPTIVDQYKIEDLDLFLKDIGINKTTSQNPQDGTDVGCRNSVDKRWFFDVQWSDCPKEVEDEVRESWRDYELGNDRYFWRATIGQELFNDYPMIYFWLKHKGVQESEEVIIHWWW